LIELPGPLHYGFLQGGPEPESNNGASSGPAQTILIGGGILIMLLLAGLFLLSRRLAHSTPQPKHAAPRQKPDAPAPPTAKPKHATSRQEPRAAAQEERFQVFLSYNRQDERDVLQLAKLLKNRGLRVWLDQWELVPGRPWQEAIEAAMSRTDSTAVLVGGAGLGPWQNREMRAYLDDFVGRGLPVIPVLLPGVTAIPEWPPFLRAFTWVDLREGFTEAGIDRLSWGITGLKPPSI
jgi:nucleotide-binding universal stress UspA family protein